MADRKKDPHLGSSRLSGEVLSLASKRLDALCEKSKRDQVAKLLSKRRRKWRKKLNIDSQASHLSRRHVELEEKIVCLDDASFNLKCELVTRRVGGSDDAMKLQSQESLHSLEVFRHRLGNESEALKSYTSHRNLQGRVRTPPRLGPDHMEVVKDLEATISQAKAFSEIRKMKHAMTPRVPPLQNRTLSGNIFEQSLGILHDSEVLPELLDSEHAHLEIIGKEVSIWQEEAESADPQSSRLHMSCGSDSGMGSGDIGSGETAEAVTSPEKFADDTPGIGMEVVCEEDVEPSSISMINDVNDVESSVLPLHNGVLNGLKAPSTDFALLNLHQRSGMGQEDRSALEDSDDGEIHFKILRLLQDAHYDLRSPIRRYSNQASRSLNSSKTPRTHSSSTPELVSPEESTSSRKRGRLRKSQTPSQSVSTATPPNKKRGRPRKTIPTL